MSFLVCLWQEERSYSEQSLLQRRRSEAALLLKNTYYVRGGSPWEGGSLVQNMYWNGTVGNPSDGTRIVFSNADLRGKENPEISFS